MKVLVATDSYKGSLTTFQASNAIKEGILLANENASVEISPIADGGEGTLETIVYANNGKICKVNVLGPLGKEIESQYGIVNDTAIIEMASASGITLIKENERNPLHTTTFGVGQLILHALKNNCRRFIVGIGGSATNDGGVGMLQALGVDFLDDEGKPVPYGAIGLSMLAQIDTKNMPEEIFKSSFVVACDVKNPLCGENGCSAIFGPQKGATEEMVKDMDNWLSHYASLTEKATGAYAKNAEGAGAAGGLGFAFLSYLNAQLMSGIDIVIKETKLEEKIKEADIVVTGEGKLDNQSCMGKAPIGVAKLAKKHDKKVIAFAGTIGKEATECNDNGIDAYFSIINQPCTLNEAMSTENAYINLKNTAEQVFRLLK